MKQNLTELIDLEEEKKRRRKEIDLTNSLFNNRNCKAGDTCYYQQLIYSLIDDKYVSLIYDFDEECKAKEVFNKFALNNSNIDVDEWIIITKRIYTDLENNCFDLLNIDESYLIDNYK